MAKAKKKEGRVVSLCANADRPEDSLGYLAEVVSNPRTTGICVIIFDGEGHDVRVFGSIAKSHLTYACAVVSHSILGQG